MKTAKRIAMLGTAAALLLVPSLVAPVQRKAFAETTPHRVESRLRMHQVHTGESIDVAYKVGDKYLPSSLDLLNHFLRDYRTGDDATYDPREFDLLHALMITLDRPDGLIDVVCGYRTPATNQALRNRAPVTGVSENSFHMASKAIDISVPGVSTERLRDAALSLGMGGVGYYPSSHFVHVDVGPVRTWSFGVRNSSKVSSFRRTRRSSGKRRWRR